MLAYLFLLAVPCFFALLGQNKQTNTIFLYLVAVLYILFIGFRMETGSDWPAYARMFEMMSYMTWMEAIHFTEPGYATLNWLLAQIGLGILSVNVIVAIIFIYGLLKFAKMTPQPWLALVSVTPYLIIVIGMSATRQSAAIGLVFLVLANWYQGNVKKIILSLLAISFHYSAVLVLFFVLQSMKMPSWLRWLILIVGGAVSFVVLKDTSKFAEYNQTYAVANLVSPGAIQHALLNGIPAAIYLVFIKKWNQLYGEVDLLRILAIASIISVFAVFISSTAVDRLALYLSPIQMLIYSTIPIVFKNSTLSIAIILMHFFILWVWLSFSNTAFVFLPYKNHIF